MNKSTINSMATAILSASAYDQRRTIEIMEELQALLNQRLRVHKEIQNGKG